MHFYAVCVVFSDDVLGKHVDPSSINLTVRLYFHPLRSYMNIHFS